MTFRIELFCDDKRLADILKALADAGAYAVNPMPVITNPGNGAVKPGLSDKVSVVYKHLVASKLVEFNSVHLRKFMKQAGIHPASISYVRESLVKAGVVRRGERGHYHMIKGA